jgi:hypothetical protein
MAIILTDVFIIITSRKTQDSIILNQSDTKFIIMFTFVDNMK